MLGLSFIHSCKHVWVNMPLNPVFVLHLWSDRVAVRCSNSVLHLKYSVFSQASQSRNSGQPLKRSDKVANLYHICIYLQRKAFGGGSITNIGLVCCD